jgi:polyhydroxybutyrate depolymerase
MHTIAVGGLVRSWLEVTRTGAATQTAPILMMLHGISATVTEELDRDGFLDLASSGRAELVYPVGIGESWNAGGCCGTAASEKVDDVGFLEKLVARIDPGHHRPLYLAGYSNGGRMAYTMVCSDPSIFTSFAIVNAVPQSECTDQHPTSILQMDGTKDPYVPYEPGEPGYEQPPATTQVSRLRVTDGCTQSPAIKHVGVLVLRSWDTCTIGARLQFASYIGLQHQFFAGSASTPSAADVIWAFFTNTSISSP